ncbi:MAG: hypothetical protein K2W85_13365 [Phycisphaerales bacterium]|nr:hypothetical protein [Phycisphaerales bacterium]
MSHGRAAVSPIVAALCGAMVCCWNSVFAHPPVATTAVCTVQPSAGDAGARLSILIHHDALAFMLNDTSKGISDSAMNALLDDPNDAEMERLAGNASERFVTLTIVEVGGQRAPVSIDRVPSVADIRSWAATKTPRLPVKMDVALAVELPFDATKFSIMLPEVLGPVVFTYDSGRGEPEMRLLTPGESPWVFELPPRFVDTVATDISGRPLKPSEGAMSQSGELAVVGGLIGLGVMAAAVAIVARRRSTRGGNEGPDKSRRHDRPSPLC